MRARRLIDGTSFGPEALNVIGKALMRRGPKYNVGNNPVVVARLKLASAMLDSK
jgi:hypothetical protein